MIRLFRKGHLFPQQCFPVCAKNFGEHSGQHEGPAWVLRDHGRMEHKIDTGYWIGEISMAGYGIKYLDGIGIRSFLLVGCRIVLKLIAGCGI